MTNEYTFNSHFMTWLVS